MVRGIFLYVLLVQLCNIIVTHASQSCGSIMFYGPLNCQSGYHCCDPRINTCCPDYSICISNNTACLHLAAIIVPAVGGVGIIVAVVICCYCCKRRRAQSGTVLQPGHMMVPQQNQ